MAPLRVSLSDSEWLMEEILLRLPVKSLLQCKCVCKSWHSLISKPQFAKLHFDLAAAPTHRLLVKFADDSKANCIDIDAPLHSDSDVVFNLPHMEPSLRYKCRRVYVMGSCRGFLLLTTSSSISDFSFFVVWNPLTGVQKRLNKELKGQFVCGIGYDSLTDDYVVVIVMFPQPQDQEVHCFSSRTNSWSCTEGAIENIHTGCKFREEGSLLNGALHWLVHTYDNRHKIIAFDVTERRLSEIPLPHDPLPHHQFASSQTKTCSLMVMGGCLCFTGFVSILAVVWMMKEYKVQSSWTKLLVVSGSPMCHFFPICNTKDGEIFGNRYRRLMKLNHKGKWLECRQDEQYKGAISVSHPPTVYTESLLSLP